MSHKIGEVNMIKINDTVKYNSSIGKVIEKKLIETPSFLSNFTLYRVEFEERNKEWINGMYLTKIKSD
jgi:hypothetical protein